MQVAPAMQDIGSETYAHGKVGHYPFSACRYTQRELFAKRGSAECLFLAGIVELGSVILCINVGAGIIDTVQGYSCTEFISEVIHRSETEPGYAVFAGSGDLYATPILKSIVFSPVLGYRVLPLEKCTAVAPILRSNRGESIQFR